MMPRLVQPIFLIVIACRFIHLLSAPRARMTIRVFAPFCNQKLPELHSGKYGLYYSDEIRARAVFSSIRTAIAMTAG
jgi:hypothetical protein